MQKRRDGSILAFLFLKRATSSLVHVAVREAIVREATLKDALSFLQDVNSIIASGLQSAIQRIQAQHKQ